jgi:hypothetical protein
MDEFLPVKIEVLSLGCVPLAGGTGTPAPKVVEGKFGDVVVVPGDD